MAAREEALVREGGFPQLLGLIERPILNFLSFTRRKPIAGVSAILLVVILVMAIAAPLVATHDPVATDTPHKLEAPSTSHFFGTDDLGRDVYSRLIHGGRVSLTIAYGATALSMFVATFIALLSGYLGGKADLFIQRFVDAMMSVPNLLLILAVVTILEPSKVTLIFVIGIIFSIRESRIIRSAVLGIKVMPYVDAARAMGASPLRIVLQHILPNVFYVIIIVGSLAVGSIIIVEAIIGFLGFGVPPPTPTWGQMLSGTARTFMTQAPWMGIAPGVAISLAVLSFNMLGDGLRDVLDPRLRKAA